MATKQAETGAPLTPDIHPYNVSNTAGSTHPPVSLERLACAVYVTQTRLRFGVDRLAFTAHCGLWFVAFSALECRSLKGAAPSIGQSLAKVSADG